jgi:hypothetical protein
MALGVGAQLSGDDTGLGEVLRGTVELAQSQGDVAHVASTYGTCSWSRTLPGRARPRAPLVHLAVLVEYRGDVLVQLRRGGVPLAVLIFGERHLARCLPGTPRTHNTAKRDCRFRRGRARRRTDAGVANISSASRRTPPFRRRGGESAAGFTDTARRSRV